jgi:hypothetical protein
VNVINETSETIENRLEILTAEVVALKRKVAGLEKRLGQGSPSLSAPSGSRQSEAYSPPSEPEPDGLWSKVGQSSILPKIAAVCFVLVVALVLRTLTDNGMIGKQQGSFLGMGYAAVLLVVGWRELARQSRLAIVFPVCSAVLMYFIVLESHIRFDSISSVSAYAILFLMFMALSLTSRRFEQSGLSFLGLVGTSCVAVVIDLPQPFFAPLIMLLLVINVVAYLSNRRLRGDWWSRWIVFALTALVWILWAYGLSFALRQGREMTLFLSLAWFFPTMTSFVVIFAVMTARKAVGGEEWNSFDLVSPTLSGLFVYPLMRVVAVAWYGSGHWLGILGVLAAGLYFVAAAWLFKHSSRGGLAVCGFTFAGATVLAMAFSDAVGSIVLALPVWSAVALGLAMLSGVCEIGGIRLASYLLQGLACLAAVFSGHFVAAVTPFMGVSLVAAGLALMAGYQYRWCRRNPLSCSIGFFGKMDIKDRSGIVLILACLVNGFLFLQMVVYQILSPFVTQMPNTMIGTQSILVNTGAIGLMFFALSERNREIMGVAVLVFVVGAGKVFFYDFFKSSGLPLVMSVFSFGVAAAVCSIAFNRWHQKGHPDLQETVS